MAGSVKLNERKRNTTKSEKQFLQEGDGKENPSQVQKQQRKQEKNEQPQDEEKNGVRRNCNLQKREPNLMQQAH